MSHISQKGVPQKGGRGPVVKYKDSKYCTSLSVSGARTCSCSLPSRPVISVCLNPLVVEMNKMVCSSCYFNLQSCFFLTPRSEFYGSVVPSGYAHCRRSITYSRRSASVSISMTSYALSLRYVSSPRSRFCTCAFLQPNERQTAGEHGRAFPEHFAGLFPRYKNAAKPLN